MSDHYSQWRYLDRVTDYIDGADLRKPYSSGVFLDITLIFLKKISNKDAALAPFST